jgi:hypothetical protein
MQLMMTILTAAPLGRADVKPIGGPVTRAAEPIRLDERLHQPNPMPILNLPVGCQPAAPLSQQVAGQVFDLHPGRNEEAALITDPGQSRQTSLPIPANELVSHRAFPRSRSENTSPHNSPVPVPRQILQIFSHRTGIGQIVMLME